MKFGGLASILSHMLNFVIFIYFAIILLRTNALDIPGLLISAFGLFVSILANVVSVLEERNDN